MIDFFNLEDISSLIFIFFKTLLILESNTHPKEEREEGGVEEEKGLGKYKSSPP